MNALAWMCPVAVAQLVVPLALFAWARRVARVRGDAPRWRWASGVPLVALVLGALTYVVPIGAILFALARDGDADAGTRATALARAISTGMNVGAVALAFAAALCVVSVGLSSYGAFGRR